MLVLHMVLHHITGSVWRERASLVRYFFCKLHVVSYGIQALGYDLCPRCPPEWQLLLQ
jgi:hypothetical protein